jgi:hypothetical protein
VIQVVSFSTSVSGSGDVFLATIDTEMNGTVRQTFLVPSPPVTDGGASTPHAVFGHGDFPRVWFSLQCSRRTIVHRLYDFGLSRSGAIDRNASTQTGERK